MLGEMHKVSMGVRGHEHEAVLCLPAAASAPSPGVVVIHDLLGFGQDIRRHCERFAEAGYAALAPDLYRGRAPGCVVQTLLSATTGEGLAYEVIGAARRTLEARDDVDANRVGVVGFCLGGGFALIAAADQSFAVAAPFYGAVPPRASRLEGLCPTIAQYGGRDTVFMSHARRLVRHLETLGIPHEVHIYDNAGHSFMNQLEGPLAPLGRYTPIRASYDRETEAQAWERLLDFFARHLPSSAAPGPPGA